MIGNFYMTDIETIKKIENDDLTVGELIYDEEDNVSGKKTLDIDKSWHAIHFTLTGEFDEGNNDNLLAKVIFCILFTRFEYYSNQILPVIFYLKISVQKIRNFCTEYCQISLKCGIM